MNKKVFPLLLAGIVFLALNSCKDKKESPYVVDELSTDYFPLAVNKYITYDVDSLVFNDSTCEEAHQKLLIRHTIVDSFRDKYNRRSFRVETRSRAESGDWKPGAVNYLTPLPDGLEYVENNLRFVKLVFPVEDGRTWQGNALNPATDNDLLFLAGWNYRYTNLGVPFTQNDKYYDTTFTVMQVDSTVGDPSKDPESFAMRLYGKEIYARKVGLVYKEFTYWTYDPATTKCKKGWKVIMKAVDFN